MTKTQHTQTAPVTHRARQLWLLVAALGVLLVAAGCTSIGNMQEQPKLHKPFEESPNFESAARELDPNAVPVGYLRDDTHFYTGFVDGELATTFPVEVTAELLLEGRRQYEGFCVPCHGHAGYGDGVIVQEGFPRATSYHDPVVRGLPVGHYFDVITNGQGAMVSYAARVAPDKRWAIIAYIRALQLSQNAAAADLPDDMQAALAASEAAPASGADADVSAMSQVDG